MTQKAIDEQIAAIKTITAEAAVSKEAALAFLRSAGIKDTPEIIHSKTIKPKNTKKEVSAHA